MKDQQPNQFGRYLLVKKLATGGMAELFLAILPGPSGFEKNVAIKKILPALGESSRFRKMFSHEGRLMAKLSHRNLVQVFELGEVNGELYMCLEYVPGCDLGRVLNFYKNAKRAFEPFLAAWICREICLGLSHVHQYKDEQGRALQIVHRDVNPRNILLSQLGDVKLGDFGIANSVVKEVFTQQGQVKGKFAYLSPEQAVGEEVGPSSDLYAVGLILYEMLTSVRYIQGTGEIDLLRNAANPIWRPISSYCPNLPEGLEDIVQRALRPQPEQRFADVAAFAEALTQVLQRSGSSSFSQELLLVVTQTLGYRPQEQLAKELFGTPVSESGENVAFSHVPDLSQTPTDKGQAGEPDEPLSQTKSLIVRQPSASRPRQTKKWTLIAASISAVCLAGALAILGPWQSESPQTAGIEHDPNGSNPNPPTTNNIPSFQSKEPVSSNERKPKDPLLLEIPKEVQLVGKQGEDPARPKGVNKTNSPKPIARQPSSEHTTSVPTILLATSDPKPGTPASQNQDILQQELQRVQQRLTKKGIRANDCPSIEALQARARQELANQQLDQAEKTIRELHTLIDAQAMDRAFIENKIRRLQLELSRRNQEEVYSEPVRKILNHAINNRFGEANATINSILDKLGR